MDLLEKINQVAAMAGIRGQRQGNVLVYSWELGGGREHICYVAPLRETDAGLHIICFFAPCERIDQGLLSGMSRVTAIKLLRYNANLDFGHFCLMKIGEEELLCVRATQILETMEIQEFEENCLGIVRLADAWEEKLGRDEF